MALLVGRGAAVALAVTAALALAVPPASAVVSATTQYGDTVTIETTDPGDVVSMACVTDLANVSGSSALPELACTDVAFVDVDARSVATTVNLGGVTQLAFPGLVSTSVNVDDDDADSVTGSEGRDFVLADSSDTVTGGLGDDSVEGAGTASGGEGDDAFRDITTVQGGAGDDWVEGAGTASGGEGDDVLRDVTAVEGGPGNDRIVNPGAGGIDGGEGHDVVVADYTDSTQPATVILTISDTTLAGVPSTGIEQYHITTSTGVRNDSIDSRAYSGVLVVETLDGNDTVRGGPGADVVDGGFGDDNLNPGPGADLVRGGEGDDTITVRDGVADSVDCGPGTDTVTADRADVLTGCENVSFPPPETSVIVGEKKVHKNDKVQFAFAASVATATFECAIDTGPYKPCTSPLTVKSRKLAVGKHTLTVRAVQPAGNADPTPSMLVFKVKPKKK